MAGEPTEKPSGIDMHLSPRNLLLIFVLFAGGATGTSVATVARSDSVPPSLASDVRDLKADLASLTTTLAKIEGALSQRRDDVGRIEKVLDDHEHRLRRVEASTAKPR